MSECYCEEKARYMQTGIWGEIQSAPQEALIFYSKKLLATGKIRREFLEIIENAIKQKVWFEPVMAEVFDHIPRELYDDYMRQYAPDEREYAFTDDTTLSIAIMEAILTFGMQPDVTNPEKDFQAHTKGYLVKWGRKYPNVGYGKFFQKFLETPEDHAYKSIGNGAAMRTAPLGYLWSSASYLSYARKAAAISHGNPEAIRATLMVTDAIAYADQGLIKDEIKTKLEHNYFYDLGRPLEEIRPRYHFESEAAKSVPEAVIAFLESTDAESAVYNAISLGGDTDTQAMIAGCIADAYYGNRSIPIHILKTVEDSLPAEMYDILRTFEEKFIFKLS